ncbi:hypothetical protein [Bradyrhizobium sp. AUGA SZCCT0283]|uniref:hypothetical protein n=1 Tax=Bradyrhizobium sp. AUGA SZCCT0283 TaxID=2807671 RepID=UPI001BA7AC23|nr:hypothetical protein [Bradyrhizobium sp. AUGA SZCCT0283]MBR1278768.1 hypothetical protein [Bradyrhizobium sp. AUGA SZCCT0283]
MAKRWSAEDVRELKTLARTYSAQAIAEKMDRTVGGVTFKAHQLGLPLKARSRATDPESTDLDRERPRAASVTPASVEVNFSADAVSAASLAGAVGIQRMGGEDAHADQGEDTC